MNSELKFTKTHEWVEYLDEKTVRLGLTDYAVEELGDLVFINLPEVEDEIQVGEPFADVESVKAVSDVYSPFSGMIKEVNEDLLDQPELINENPYDAWLIEVENISDTEELLTKEEYEELIRKEE
jgi:glycine cleavage system H protein